MDVYELIVISDNDKPFKISQFSVWPIFIINSVKVQQNLFSSGLQISMNFIYSLSSHHISTRGKM